MTEDTTFWVASCTKLLTTIAALQCVEKGQLTLDDDVSSILPEWKTPELLNGFDEDTGEPQISTATKKITLRHLLTHSSGLSLAFLTVEIPRVREWRKEKVDDKAGDIVSV